MDTIKKFLFIIVLLPLFLTAQDYTQKKGSGLYNSGGKGNDKGWYASIGLTYMIPYLKEVTTTNFTDTLNNLFTQTYTADPKGKLGLSADIGRFKMTDKRVINYIDYGIAYKCFGGREDFTSDLYRNDTLLTTSTTKGTYSDHIVSGHLNLGYRFDKDYKTFYVNGLGLNLDYFFSASRKGGGVVPGEAHEFTQSLIGELHYFFGIGFKSNRLIIMPIIETPILALYPFNHIVSTHDYFNTRARPVVLKVRFMLLDKPSKDCPKVFDPGGVVSPD